MAIVGSIITTLKRFIHQQLSIPQPCLMMIEPITSTDVFKPFNRQMMRLRESRKHISREKHMAVLYFIHDEILDFLVGQRILLLLNNCLSTGCNSHLSYGCRHTRTQTLNGSYLTFCKMCTFIQQNTAVNSYGDVLRPKLANYRSG